MITILQSSDINLTNFLLIMSNLIFTFFLLIVYFSKKKLDFIKCKIYRLMLITVVIVMIPEAINLVTIMFKVKHESAVVFAVISYLFHWATIVFWFILFYCHSICYLGNIEAKSFKEFIKSNKKVRRVFWFVILCLPAYLYIFFSDLSQMDPTYLANPSEYYVLCMLSIIAIWILLEAFVFIKDVPKKKKISTVLVMSVITCIVIVQLYFPNIGIYSLLLSLQVFYLYFITENPEIYMKSELETLKKEIDKSNSAKTDFISNMSHEIRTPMNAIAGFSDMLINNPEFDSNRARSDIQNISLAGNNLLDIINNILDISKIESGKDVLEEKNYELGNIINELSNIIKSRLSAGKVKFYVDLSENTPSGLYGDSTKIYQILLNILGNSAKYTEVGKIKLSISSEFIDNEYVILHFKVADTGYGIKKEDYDKLFEKFNRLDSAVSNDIEGTGLGLVITKKYVNLLDGKIWFDSEYEVGTTFYVDVTQKVIDKSPITNIDKIEIVEEEHNYVDCSRFKALVVDDNKLNVKVAERILKKYNFNVDSVNNGKDCVYKIKAGNNYDIIFMDIMMPEMDGVEALHILKKLEGYPLCPIVALTANAIAGAKDYYLNEGFDAYLSKPINIGELDNVIHRFLDSMIVSSLATKKVFDTPKPETIATVENKSTNEMKLDDIKPLVKLNDEISKPNNYSIEEPKAIIKNSNDVSNKKFDNKFAKEDITQPNNFVAKGAKIIDDTLKSNNDTLTKKPENKFISDDIIKTDNVEAEYSKIANDTSKNNDDMSNKRLENKFINKDFINSTTTNNQENKNNNLNNEVNKNITTEEVKPITHEIALKSNNQKDKNISEVVMQKISTNDGHTINEKLSKEEIEATSDTIQNIVDKVEPLINLVPNVDLNKNSLVENNKGVEIELVKLSIKIDPDSTKKDRKGE